MPPQPLQDTCVKPEWAPHPTAPELQWLFIIIWITGAFRTSPTGGVQAIAGLMPIHLHLQKLKARSIFQAATLIDSHPTCSLLSAEYSKKADPHRLSITLLDPKISLKVKGDICDIKQDVHYMTKLFAPYAPIAQPGHHLLDLFPDCVIFHLRSEFTPPNEEDNPIPDFGEDFTALQFWFCKNHKPSYITHMDSIWTKSEEDPLAILIGTDATVPANKKHQAISSRVIFWAREHFVEAWYVAGWVLSADAELASIHFSVVKALQSPNCSNIILFMDSIAFASRAMDTSIHSGQGHSLAVCKVLLDWFSADASRTITFVDVPSKLEWDIHHIAHKWVHETPPVLGIGSNSLDSCCEGIADLKTKEWREFFFHSLTYAGTHFLTLQNLDGHSIKLSYAKGGTWLPLAVGSISLTARMTCCILGHALMGEYFLQFNIDEPLNCGCGVKLETRTHVFKCPNLFGHGH